MKKNRERPISKKYHSPLIFMELYSVLHIGLPMDLMLNYIVEHIPKEDSIILLTGVGKCYPLLRSHKILNDLHDRLAQGIVLMMFPGKYEDGYLYLFGEVKDGNNYRAKPI